MARDAANVAGYFSKQSKKEQGAKIDTSRGNLIRRESTREIIHAETFSDEIKPPAGYSVVNALTYVRVDYQMVVFEKNEEVKAKNDRRRKSNKTIPGRGQSQSGTSSRKND
jgi:hypothetical protein